MQNEKTLIIIPTYNEASNIDSLITMVFDSLPNTHILVVDDSSPDGTGDVVKKRMETDANLHLLTRPQKEGLAAAYRAGFQWAMARDFDTWVEMDADHSHNPKVLQTFVEKLKVYDAVFGCRYMKGGAISGWTLWRKMVSRMGNLYAQTVLQLPYRDLTGGYNAWKRHVIEKIGIDTIISKGYAFQVELKYRAHVAGFSLLEVPIQFNNRRFGKSKISGNIISEAAVRVVQLRFAHGT